VSEDYGLVGLNSLLVPRRHVRVVVALVLNGNTTEQSTNSTLTVPRAQRLCISWFEKRSAAPVTHAQRTVFEVKGSERC
jgi:hypothetical protein